MKLIIFTFCILFFTLSSYQKKFRLQNKIGAKVETLNVNGQQLIVSDHPFEQYEDGIVFLEKKKATKNKVGNKKGIFFNVAKKEDLNVCLGPNALVSGAFDNIKSQFQAFISGQCFPVVMIPGVMGTGLKVDVDCNMIYEKYPEIAKQCSFTDSYLGSMYYYRCPRNTVKTFQLWVASLQGPAKVKRPLDGCFSSLVKLDETELDSVKSPITDSFKFKPRPGITVDWQDFNENAQKNNTFDQNLAGFQGINNLANSYVTKLFKSETVGYENMQEYLKEMGYQLGLSLYGLPYDWRYRAGQNEVQQKLTNIINQAYELTGKKVIIVTHSFGSLNTLHALNNMDSETKSRVERWIPIGPPFMGAPGAAKEVLTGDEDMPYDFSQMRKVAMSATGVWDLVPKAAYDAKSDWGKAILKRLSIESGLTSGEDTDFNWFPDPSKGVCLNIETDTMMDSVQKKLFSVDIKQKKCGLTDQLYNYFKNPIAKLQNGKSSNLFYDNSFDQIQNLICTHGFLVDPKDKTEQQNYEDRCKKMFESVRLNQLQLLKNPEVPVSLIYGNHKPTVSMFDFASSPRDYTNNGKYVPKEQTLFSNNGDGTVVTDSALVPLLKWGYEFQNNKIGSPVEVIEYCSKYAQALQEEEYVEEQVCVSWGSCKTEKVQKFGLLKGYSKPTSNRYVGLKCDRQEHAGMIADQYVIKYIAEIVKTSEKVTTKTQLTEQQLNDLQNYIPALRRKENSKLNLNQVFKWIEEQQSKQKRLSRKIHSQKKTHNVLKQKTK